MTGGTEAVAGEDKDTSALVASRLADASEGTDDVVAFRISLWQRRRTRC